MRRSRLLSLCLCFALSGYAVHAQRFSVDRDSIGGATIQNGFPDVFRPIGKIFKRFLGIKPKPSVCGIGAQVTNLGLSATEIITGCSSDTICRTADPLVKVTTTAVVPEDVAVVFGYTVSGGKIIGDGANVVWDLQGVKPGEYTITAAIDSGDGFIGVTQTRAVKVVECAECK